MLEIQGFPVRKENLDKLYDHASNIYFSAFDMYPADYLSLCNTQRPASLLDTDEFYETTDIDLYAGVQEREGSGEEYFVTAGAEQNFTRRMKRREAYSMMEIPEEVIESGKKDPFHLINWLEIFSQKSAYEQSMYKNQNFWNIFNKGTLSAGYHDVFDQSLPSGKKLDSSGDVIYDGKPLFAASGNNHPRSNTDSTNSYYNLTVSKAWSRDAYQDVKTLVETTNNRDIFGRRFRNKVKMVLANSAMERYIEPDIESAVDDADMQVNLLKGKVFAYYSDFIDDTDAWFAGDPTRAILWVDQWKEPLYKIWEEPRQGIWLCRMSTFYGYMFLLWNPLYACNQATS